ncbi:MAG: hypothetical protein HY907_16800 [Deltaproteobacteria bacterium]|nr:hypothetical protein [Deltaproteobacteria bacterium]
MVALPARPAQAYFVYYDMHLTGAMTWHSDWVFWIGTGSADIVEYYSGGHLPSFHESTLYRGLDLVWSRELSHFPTSLLFEQWDDCVPIPEEPGDPPPSGDPVALCLSACANWQDSGYLVPEPTPEHPDFFADCNVMCNANFFDSPRWVCMATGGPDAVPDCMRSRRPASSGDCRSFFDFDPDSTTLASGGVAGAQFKSLLVGARFPDLREADGMEAANIEGDAFEDILNKPPWDNKLDFGYQFPAQHSLARTDVLEEDALYEVPWYTTGDDHVYPVAGVAERNRAVMTAAASFLFDRFLQAQQYEAMGDGGAPPTVPVHDYHSVDQSLRQHPDLAVAIAGVTTHLFDGGCAAALVLTARKATSRGDLQGRVLASFPACALLGPATTNYWAAVHYAFADGGGDVIEVHPDLLAIGQGVHTIGDSFAHWVRDYTNAVVVGDAAEALPLARLRSEGETPWFYGHSRPYDHDASYYAEGVDPWSGDVFGYPSSGDSVFYDAEHNRLGLANHEFSARAIADWLAVFYDPAAGTSRGFQERLQALEQFTRRHFSYAMPQELAPGEVAKYQPGQLCDSDDDCERAFLESGVFVPGVCDLPSGLCRKPCTVHPDGTDDCNPGFTCSSGISWTGSPGIGDRRFCSVLWDPWDSIADEYLVGMQRREDGDHGRFRLPKTSRANEWYMLEYDVPPVAPADEASGERIDSIDPLVMGERQRCRADTGPGGSHEGEELVAILFTGLTYTTCSSCARPICQYRTPGSSGFRERAAMSSIYVEPGQHVCLTNSDSDTICFHGGINGTAEGRLLEEWRGREVTLSYDSLDLDGDHVEDWTDNCMLSKNSDQADFDGDRYGDACDRDDDGDLVLEDGDGPWGLGDGDEVPCGFGGPERGQACDDNCPRTYNPARLDLAPIATATEPAGDGVPDQFDLDGDGFGDACDGDPDGDRTHLRYPFDYDYGLLDEEQGHPRPGESVEGNIVGECAEFLWTLTEDKDDDWVCDLYNFIPDGNVPPPWVPDPRYNGWPFPNQGYLKPDGPATEEHPEGFPVSPDIMNAHYLSSCFRNQYGPGDGSCFHPGDVTIVPPPDSGASHYPGEGGYSWYLEYRSIHEDSAFGYEGCLRNLVDVWHYYADETTDTTVGVSGFYERELRAGFMIGAAQVVALLDVPTTEAPMPYWTPPDPGHEPGSPADTEWRNMLLEIGEKRRQLERNLDPQMCQVDNCIRFTRLHGPLAVGVDDIDPLSYHVLQDDQYLGEELGTMATDFCWTENTHELAGDGPTAVYNTQLRCDFCDAVPVPSPGQCRRDEDPDPYTAPGYAAWYRNEDQLDVNRDGIGDMCSSWVELVDMQQKHLVQESSEGVWPTEPEWRSYITAVDSTGSPTALAWRTETHDGVRMDVPYDLATGLPIRWYEEDWRLPTRGTVSGPGGGSSDELTEICRSKIVHDPEGRATEVAVCGAGEPCEVHKSIASNMQQLSFDVSGFSLEPVETTIGACACAFETFERCYDPEADPDDRCWRPEDADWETDRVSYDALVVAAEFLPDTVRSRYAGFRLYGNRDATWATRVIAEPCQHLVVRTGGLYGGGPDIHIGWATEDPLDDGCQEIRMPFHGGDRRVLTWSYPGQVEPGPTGPLGTGDQHWMDGYTTAMRVGIRKELPDPGDPAAKYWRRQFHTPVYGPETPGIDDDEPFAETWFRPTTRGRSGFVVFAPDCRPARLDDDDIVDDSGLDWPGDSSTDKAVVRVQVKEATDKAEATLEYARVMSGSGEVALTSSTYTLGATGFPSRDFATARLNLDREVAAALFDYSGTEPSVSVDIVVGGTDALGQPVGGVWASRSWDETPRFDRLDPGGPPKPPASASDATKPPPSASPAIADPRLFVDLARRRLLILGGVMPGGVPLGQILVFDLATRTWTTGAVGIGKSVGIPPGASTGDFAVDRGGRRAFLVASGGSAVRVFELDLSLSVPLVREIAIAGSGPAPRQGAAVTYSSRLHQVLLFGGAAGAIIGTGPVAAGAATEPGAPGGGGTVLGDVWGLEPRTGIWTLLRPDGGLGIARQDAKLFAGRNGEAYVLGGKDATGPLPVDRAVQIDLLDSQAASWRTTNSATPRLLVVDGPPQHGYWRPGDPPTYSLVGHDLQRDLSHPAQLVLEADPTLLQVTAVSSTSKQLVSGAVSAGNGMATLSLLPKEVYYVAVRGLTEVVPRGGIPFTLRAVSALPQGRHWNVRAPDMTRFDASKDAVFVANWESLDIYKWEASALTKVAEVPMQAAVDVDVVDGIAYVADFEQGLVTVSVTDPTAPLVLDTEWVLGTPDSVAVSGKNVFLGTGIFGVAELDVTDPADVAWVAQISPVETPPAALSGPAGSSRTGPVTGSTVVADVSAGGNRLLLADSDRTLWIYVVDASGSAQQVGRYEAALPIEDSAVHGRTLYLTDGHGTLEVVDVTSASAPSRLTLSHGPEWEVSGRYGYDMMVQRDVGGRIAVLEMRELLPDEDVDEDDGDDDHCDDGHGEDGHHAGCDGDPHGGCDSDHHAGGDALDDHHDDGDHGDDHAGGHGGPGHDDDDDEAHGGRGDSGDRDDDRGEGRGPDDHRRDEGGGSGRGGGHGGR